MGISEMAKMPARRDFILGMLRGFGAAGVGGLFWASHLDGKNSYPLILRPPGCVSEGAFLSKCTRCGLCIEACPYKALVLARPGEGKPLGTPYFMMRENPCRMCTDIPCAVACPTGALDADSLSENDVSGRKRLMVNRVKIGLAVIDRETCIAYWGIQCDACYRSCPVIDKAITVEPVRNARTGKHAFLAPAVHSDHCTGCGLCEHVCVTKKASIFVLPRSIAMGESSVQYIKGWEEKDEERLKELTEEAVSITPRSEKNPLDYLNRGEF